MGVELKTEQTNQEKRTSAKQLLQDGSIAMNTINTMIRRSRGLGFLCYAARFDTDAKFRIQMSEQGIPRALKGLRLASSIPGLNSNINDPNHYYPEQRYLDAFSSVDMAPGDLRTDRELLNCHYWELAPKLWTNAAFVDLATDPDAMPIDEPEIEAEWF